MRLLASKSLSHLVVVPPPLRFASRPLELQILGLHRLIIHLICLCPERIRSAAHWLIWSISVDLGWLSDSQVWQNCTCALNHFRLLMLPLVSLRSPTRCVPQGRRGQIKFQMGQLKVVVSAAALVVPGSGWGVDNYWVVWHRMPEDSRLPSLGCPGTLHRFTVFWTAISQQREQFYKTDVRSHHSTSLIFVKKEHIIGHPYLSDKAKLH